MDKETIKKKHSEYVEIVKKAFLDTGFNTLEESESIEIDYNANYEYCKKIFEKFKNVNVDRGTEFTIKSVTDKNGNIISLEEYTEKVKDRSRISHEIHYGDFKLDHQLFGKETTIKVLKSNVLNSKNARGFYGKFFVLVNTEDPLKSKIIKKNSVINYLNAIDISRTDQETSEGYNIDLDKLQNFCYIEDYRLYIAQRQLCDAENNPEMSHELELAYFNKYKSDKYKKKN